MAGTVFKIPLHLKATSASGLSDAMLKQNLSDKTEYNYFNIHVQGKYWYAWYYKNIEETIRANRVRE